MRPFADQLLGRNTRAEGSFCRSGRGREEEGFFGQVAHPSLIGCRSWVVVHLLPLAAWKPPVAPVWRPALQVNASHSGLLGCLAEPGVSMILLWAKSMPNSGWAREPAMWMPTSVPTPIFLK
jgi:hypothetical protein